MWRQHIKGQMSSFKMTEACKKKCTMYDWKEAKIITKKLRCKLEGRFIPDLHCLITIHISRVLDYSTDWISLFFTFPDYSSPTPTHLKSSIFIEDAVFGYQYNRMYSTGVCLLAWPLVMVSFR